MRIITLDIKNANENFRKNLIFREDILKAVDELKKAKLENIHLKRSLVINMFRAHDIDCNRDISADQCLELLQQSNIPSISTLPDLCWREMIELYKNYKHPKDYMERLVNTLVSPAYDTENSSVRLKILKQFLGELNYLEGTRYYDENLKEIVLREYNGVIADIKDEIFDKYMLPGHINRPNVLLEAILVAYSDILYDADETDKNLSLLIGEYDEKIATEKAQKILAYIYSKNYRDREKRQSYYEINDENPSLIERMQLYLNERMILKKKELEDKIDELETLKKDRVKQFSAIKQVYISGEYRFSFLNNDFRDFLKSHINLTVSDETPEKVLMLIEKAASSEPKKFAKINQLLIYCLRQYKKEKNEIYRDLKEKSRESTKDMKLLQICDDLAEGKFKDKISEMKELLYVFAFAFDMTIYTGKNKWNYDFKRDVKRQLFEDFYCDNVIRYIHDFQTDGGSEEPDGITIQYKNFVEIVYLYWLNKETTKERTCYKKLKKANEMIDEIVKEYKKTEKQKVSLKIKKGEKYKRAKEIVDKKDKLTIAYRNFFEGNRKNYDYYGERNLAVGELLGKSEAEFKEFLLKNYNVNIKHYSGQKSNEAFENEGKQNTAENVYSNLKNKIIERIVRAKKECDDVIEMPNYPLEFFEATLTEDYDAVYANEFIKLVDKIDDIMLKIEYEDKKVTRTKLMVLYYIDFIQKNKGKNYSESFPDFYIDYRDGLNDLFSESAYQFFSNKNLLDVMLMYSAFINLRVKFR